MNISDTNIDDDVLQQSQHSSQNNQHVLFDKIKKFLVKKLTELEERVKKLKRKKKIYKCIIVLTSVVSIIISVVLASIAPLMISTIAITVLSIISGSLTGISINFNLRNRVNEIEKELISMCQIQSQLDYLTSCNGHLTEEDYNKLTSSAFLSGLHFNTIFP